MPALPPGLSEWLPSGFFTAFLGLVWYELKAGEARVNRRMDDLRDGVNKRMDELREDQKELRKKVDDLRDEVKGLPLKIMELLRQPVTPER
ncbi:MAG: hypothetical protein OXI08_00810 [Cyanobacteria bacterium MAG IRC4_bin_6]|nr:hypothetical protein [Cyanobacteria bacterium MAG IRC4_bin_6]